MALIKSCLAGISGAFTEVNKGALTNNSTTPTLHTGNLLIVFYSSTAPRDVSGLTQLSTQDGSGGAPHCIVYTIDSDAATLTSGGGMGFIEVSFE